MELIDYDCCQWKNGKEKTMPPKDEPKYVTYYAPIGKIKEATITTDGIKMDATINAPDLYSLLVDEILWGKTRPLYPSSIKKVIFNDPATIVIWSSGKKTVVKVKPGETFDKWTGFAMCLLKYQLGETRFHQLMRRWCK